MTTCSSREHAISSNNDSGSYHMATHSPKVTVQITMKIWAFQLPYEIYIKVSLFFIGLILTA
jgi:hypothetical protein